jgi:pimeloyl-ACP methyl ester carboxylesterase
MKPTVILVHGAFAESSSWNDVIDVLTAEGLPTIAMANPLRGITADAAALSDLVRSVDGPVVLVGHSYGGAVITNIDPGAGDVHGLVFVAGYALEAGESCVEATNHSTGGSLATTLQPVDRSDGSRDLYIAQEKYHQQFCADLSADVALQLAVTQRPIVEAALTEPAGDTPLWKTVPSWFIYGEEDRNIPAGSQAFMASRAQARSTVVISGASHVVGMSHPAHTAEVILESARAAELTDTQSA